MNPRHRIFVLLGVLTLGCLVWFLAASDPFGARAVLGTVDAQQVLVGTQVAGRIQKLLVTEGQDVKAGDLVALLDPAELGAAEAASRATAQGLEASAGSAQGETVQALAAARATLEAAKASQAEAEAALVQQEGLTRRTVALAAQGIQSVQDRETAEQALKGARARSRAALEQVTAAQAAVASASARLRQAEAARESALSARALAAQAGTRLGYTRVTAPVSGKVGLWAVREGEVVQAGATLITLVDLSQTWVYAPVPETAADLAALGDVLTVRMPSGARVEGRVIAKAAEADFATQRDVGRRKRDIRTVRLKLLIPNAEGRFVPGMTAEVALPKGKR